MSKTHIYMIGDSIMQTNKYDTFPCTGWGQVLNLFIDDEKAEVINLAKNGTSTKSFLDQGRFKIVEDNIIKDDILIIGFAHNDEKEYDSTRYTSPQEKFIENLTYFINVAKKAKAFPILLTPMIRRKYVNGELINTHGKYVEAIRNCANANNVPCADINKLATEYFQTLNEEESKRYFMNFEKKLYFNFPLGNNDDSHLRYDGAVLVARFFVQEVYRLNLEIKSLFNKIKIVDLKNNDTSEK